MPPKKVSIIPTTSVGAEAAATVSTTRGSKKIKSILKQPTIGVGVGVDVEELPVSLPGKSDEELEGRDVEELEGGDVEELGEPGEEPEEEDVEVEVGEEGEGEEEEGEGEGVEEDVVEVEGEEDVPEGTISRRGKSKKSAGKQRQKKGTLGEGGEGDDESDDEGEFDITQDDDYLQRYHPEMIYPDSREVQMYLREYSEGTKKRISRPILSKYEATSIVGMRAQQLSRGSEPYVQVDETDPIEVAKIELRAKIIPVIVRRVLPNGVSEYWRLSELMYFEN
jgi:DNA-directed RNA polymerases I, II, and III subunit RPABC2